MRAAAWPRPDREAERLLVVDTEEDTFVDARIADLPRFFRAGDLLVVNDAATFPASLVATRDARAPADETPFEARLVRPGAAWAGPQGGASGVDSADANVWTVLLLGPGTYRTRTEDCPRPPPLERGDALTLGVPDANGAGVLHARVVGFAPFSRDLVLLAFREKDAAFWRALYHSGKPVQYAYVPEPLELWHVQTAYAGPPVAAEMPSAGRPLTWNVLHALRQRGVRLATLTHAAGFSSSGDRRIDERLPLRETYEIPAATARAVESTRHEGGRVVAVGTSVVRALESAAEDGESRRESTHGRARIRAGRGETDLVIGPEHRLRSVDALVTGMHERGASHFGLLRAFASSKLLSRAYAHAEKDYLGHEFGDTMLITANALQGTAPR